MGKSVLLLVDLQNDFMPGGALPVPEGDSIIPIINTLQDRFDLIVATQDWHPADHGSFAIAHPPHKPFDIIEWGGVSQVLWPAHCVQNTKGSEFVSGLDQTRFHQIIQKGTDPTIDSYSGFFDNAHRKATGLEAYLKNQGVENVYIVGVATDYCVKYTALDACKLGFKTYLIENACRGVGLRPADVPEAIDEMRQAGAEII